MNDPNREQLREVAAAQKGVIYCLLVRILLIPLVVAGNIAAANDPQIAQIVRPMALGLDLLIGLIALYFVFRLASKVYNPALGVLFGILTCVPCIGLIILLVVNGAATRRLQAAGIKVGLMGADMSQFR